MARYNLRRLKGSRVLIVLLWNLLLFSYHQSSLGSLVSLITFKDGFQPSPWQLAILTAALSDVVPKLLYPFAGWLADAKLGRYKVMRYSMWVMWIGSILLIITSIVCYLLLDKEIWLQSLPVFVIVYLVNAVGIAGYHVNVIPFGIDQMEGPSGEQIASFIHWYYWTRNFNFGVIVQMGVRFFWDYGNDDATTHYEHHKQVDLVILIIQMFFLTAAISLDFLLSSKLFKDAKTHNPVKIVRQISAFFFKHGQPVGQRKAHTYTYDIPPLRSDFAKESYGGPFKDDEVEEVVSFWRMTVFLLSTSVGVFLIQAGFYTYPSFFQHMAVDKPPFTKVSTSTTEYLLTNSVSIVTFTLCIPIYEFFIYPFLRNRIPRTIVRIGLGFIVTLFGLSILLIMDAFAHHHASVGCMFLLGHKTPKTDLHPCYLIPVIMIMAFAEMLAYVSTLEFIVAQSPYSMRGLMLGIFFMLYGIFVALGAAVMVGFSIGFEYAHFEQPSCGTTFIAALVTMGCVGSLLYLVSARFYKERQRGGQVDINHQTVLEGYYER